MLQDLSRDDRLQLMRFVCSFAWADLEINEDERAYVRRTIETLELDKEEAAQVQQWLVVPPNPEDVDPTRIPQEHRQVFLDTVERVIMADEKITAEELENLVLFKRLV